VRASTVVIVTRPGQAGSACAEALARAGFEACWWPAFEIDLAPDAAARAAVSRLASFDCVVFVSAPAVTVVATLLDAPWPNEVAVAAVGAATAAAARSELRLSGRTRVIAPGPDDGTEPIAEMSGSEALWPLLRAAAPRRVLIARAQHGREWLAEQLKAGGAEVTSVAVYQRRALPPSADQIARMQGWRDAGVRPIVLFTSSEAVDVMFGDGAAGRLMQQAVAMATHPRIAARLRESGATSVGVAPSAGADALIAHLRSLEFQQP
jgi:uroporphyrinogen-III synthase